MFWLCTLVILSLSISVFNLGTDKNYGPYKLNWDKYETCKGPKKNGCGKVTIEDAKNMSDIIFILDILVDCPITKAKILLSTNEMNSKKKLFNYALDRPCQHFVIGPFLYAAFNSTEKACKINKGYHKIHVNMNDETTKFIGSSFFYGNYSFKLFAHNAVNNVFCIESTLAVDKRKS